MTLLTDAEWEPLFFEDVFDEFQRGKRLVAAKRETGDTPVVSSQGWNNGVTGFAGNNTRVRHFSDCLSIANGGSSAGKAFFQPYCFIGADHVTQCMMHDGLSVDEGLGLSVLVTNALVGKYGFSHEIKDDALPRERMVSPVSDNGKCDYAGLAQYAQSVRKQKISQYKSYISRRIAELEHHDVVPLDAKEWKVFDFSYVFDIRKGFYNKKPEDSGLGTIPFLGAIDSRNGMTRLLTLEEIEVSSKTGDANNSPLDKKLFPGHAIAVTNNGSVGHAYYQATQFTCSHDINPLYLRDHEMNRYEAMFLIPVIEKQGELFQYARKWRPARMVKSKILLPVTSDGEPDYSYMEQYAKNMMLKKYKQYLAFIDR